MQMNMNNREREEKLREVAATGDNETVISLLAEGVNVNSQNAMNGWTALHWACKRGHTNIVETLLHSGADPTVATFKGETCSGMTTNSNIRTLVGGGSDVEKTAGSTSNTSSSFIPNYLANPPFPYFENKSVPAKSLVSERFDAGIDSTNSSLCGGLRSTEIVLKVRIEKTEDFIEIDLEKDRLTFENLVSIMCSELDIEPSNVSKIRKLPNTIVRRDKDVQRLQEYQELELVLKQK